LRVVVTGVPGASTAEIRDTVPPFAVFRKNRVAFMVTRFFFHAYLFICPVV
jgi:hypothetical protein